MNPTVRSWRISDLGEGCEDRPSKPERSVRMADEAIPYIADPESWKQYTDDILYWADVEVRRFIENASKDSHWKRSRLHRKYTLGMMFEIITGRKYEPKDAKYAPALKRVMSYYSTRIDKGGSIRGKKTNKIVYTLSPARLKKQPYSLRLRLEMMAEMNWDRPKGWTSRLPKDDLEPGHARNPRTDENIQKRRAKAREIYNERYKDRSH